jgi:hypothetical protein
MSPQTMLTFAPLETVALSYTNEEDGKTLRRYWTMAESQSSSTLSVDRFRQFLLPVSAAHGVSRCRVCRRCCGWSGGMCCALCLRSSALSGRPPGLRLLSLSAL